MIPRFRQFTFSILLLLINFAPGLSQDIRFNKVVLPDEIINATVNSAEVKGRD